MQPIPDDVRSDVNLSVLDLLSRGYNNIRVFVIRLFGGAVGIRIVSSRPNSNQVTSDFELDGTVFAEPLPNEVEFTDS